MKQGSTLFLKIVIIIIGLPILALCVLVLPIIVIEAFTHTQQGEALGYIVLGTLLLMYLSALPFYFALYQSFQLLSYIDKNIAFSELSVKALKKIKYCAITISGLYVLALPLIYIIAEWDDAPGLILFGMVILGASLVIAVFAAVLQKLLQEAINIKSENDLTV